MVAQVLAGGPVHVAACPCNAPGPQTTGVVRRLTTTLINQCHAPPGLPLAPCYLQCAMPSNLPGSYDARLPRHRGSCRNETNPIPRYHGASVASVSAWVSAGWWESGGPCTPGRRGPVENPAAQNEPNRAPRSGAHPGLSVQWKKSIGGGTARSFRLVVAPVVSAEKGTCKRHRP